jgi:putative membrane protein
MRSALAAVLIGALPVTALAHNGVVHGSTDPRALSPWDLAAFTVLLLFATLYWVGSYRLAMRGAVHRRFEQAAFALGWMAMVAAVLPPIDRWAIELFSAHMAQHELMMLVGVPLMIAGRPLPICIAGLPGRVRPAVTGMLQSRAGGSMWRGLTSPLAAWVLHGLAIWVWHLPALYDAAAGNEAIHALQHASFVSTAAFFWWGMLYGRYGRVGYGAAVFYVFTTAVHTGALGAFLTFARSPIYPFYAAPAIAHGVDQLADQQLAGLVMWIPAGFVLTVLGIALFAAWLGESERRSQRIRPLV